MKKTLFVMAALVLAIGVGVQFANPVQAVGATQASNGNGAVKVGEKNETAGQDGAMQVQTEEQNRVMNQGEETQIKTQEKNSVGNGKTVDDVKGNSAKQGNGRKDVSQIRSEVANAVQAMLRIADRDGGIGQQIRTIAQNQNQNQEKLQQELEKIQNRGAVAEFFLGADYGQIKEARKNLEQNKEQIRQLNQIRLQLANAGDQQELSQQIATLEGADQNLELLLQEAEGGFSMFGWLNRWISR